MATKMNQIVNKGMSLLLGVVLLCAGVIILIKQKGDVAYELDSRVVRF